jgi:hypothetical protein
MGATPALTALVPPAIYEVALMATTVGAAESLGLVSLPQSRLALLLSAVDLGEQLLRQAVLELDAVGSPGSPTLLYYQRPRSESTELACQSGQRMPQHPTQTIQPLGRSPSHSTVSLLHRVRCQLSADAQLIHAGRIACLQQLFGQLVHGLLRRRLPLWRTAGKESASNTLA